MKKGSLLILIIISIVYSSCIYDCDCVPQYEDAVSQKTLDKQIVEINTTNVSTGLESVFIDMFPDSTSRAEVCQFFVDNARFYNDESGYFFIETLNDAWVVAHINHDLIGTSRIDVKDENGTYFIKNMVETVKYAGYGYVEYFKKNPSNNEIERKLSFVTSIPAAQWFIGTGFYGDPPDVYYSLFDANLQIIDVATTTMAKGIGGLLSNVIPADDKVQFCQDFIDHIRFFDNGSGYFFIVDFDGINIAHGADKSREGQNDYNLQDVDGRYIIQDMIDIAKNNPGQVYSYRWENPVSGLVDYKYAYVDRIPGTDYLIASGFYLE